MKPGSTASLLVRVAVVTVGVIGLSGCAHKPRVSVRPAALAEEIALLDPAQAPRSGRFIPPPFALGVKEDAIVRVVGPQMNCSGTLIDDDLVLTAHHCVVDRGRDGTFSRSLVAARALSVELGGDYLAWGAVGVSHVVAPPCGEAGGAGDLAVLVLERKLVGVAVMPPRLENPPRLGEALTPAGFGRCALSGDAIHRALRPGGAIASVTPGTLQLSASICPGDSGGPVLARSAAGREVVGVVSLAAMDGDERTSSTSIVARIDSFRMVFANARLLADGMPPAEVPPLTCGN